MYLKRRGSEWARGSVVTARDLSVSALDVLV